MTHSLGPLASGARPPYLGKSGQPCRGSQAKCSQSGSTTSIETHWLTDSIQALNRNSGSIVTLCVTGTAFWMILKPWTKLDGLEEKVEDLNQKIGGVEAKLEARMDKLEARMDVGFAKMDARMDVGFAKMDARMDKLEAKMDACFARLDSRHHHSTIISIVGVSVVLAYVRESTRK